MTGTKTQYTVTFSNGWAPAQCDLMSEVKEEIRFRVEAIGKKARRLFAAKSADGDTVFFYLTESQRDSDQTGADAFAAVRKETV